MARQRRIEAAQTPARAICPRLVARLIATTLATLLLSGCGRPDAEQVRICRDAIAAFDRGAGPVAMLRA